MKPQVLLLATALLGAGCTATSLERLTVNQAMSVTDLRYRQVVENLAKLAVDPASLPSFSVVSWGEAQLTDTATLEPTTVWTRVINGFSTQNLEPGGKRSPNPQWTLEPAGDHEVLQALRCASLWVLYGPPAPGSDCMELLRPYVHGDASGYHFGVTDRLAKLPRGWLHIGKLKEVPLGACYKAHCGGTWVWVTPDGMEGLSQFTLVFLDICTSDFSQISPPEGATVETVVKKGADTILDVSGAVGAKQAIQVDPKTGAPLPGPVSVADLPLTSIPQIDTSVSGVTSTSAPAGRSLIRPSPKSR